MNSKDLHNRKGGRKKGEWKKTLAFWVFSILLLAGWFVFLQTKSRGYPLVLSELRPLVGFLPLEEHQKEELKIVLGVLPRVVNEEEKTYMILFQDAHELRPGGGHIEAFGILKVQSDVVISFEVHDAAAFDAGKTTEINPPYPAGIFLKTNDWKFQNSNWSADFSINAKNLQRMYGIEGGEEGFIGVIAISIETLASFLELTGPVELDGHSGEYNSRNLSSKIQYYKEKGQVAEVLEELTIKIFEEIRNLEWIEKKFVLERAEKHLIQKDILLHSNDDEIQNEINKLGWGGSMRGTEGDYLMMIDANLGSLKTDQFMKREFEYTVDFTSARPRATLELQYNHNGRVRDWQVSDYISYFRLYVPGKSWLIESAGVENIKFGQESERKYFGSIVQIPLGETREISFSYDLPKNITVENYELFLQKQPGIGSVEGKINIIEKSGEKRSYKVETKRDRKIKL